MNRIQFYEANVGAIVREAEGVPVHIVNYQNSDTNCWVVYIDVESTTALEKDIFDYLDNFGEYRFNYEIKERTSGDWHYLYFKDARNLKWYQSMKKGESVS